jgi:fibronectin type 3 domain-containing protein
VGYQLFKARSGGDFGGAPVHGKPLQEARFVDTAVQNYAAYQYKVRAVRTVKDRTVAGPFSAVVEATPQKVLPPEPPQGLVAFPTPAGVRLVWEGAEKRDVAGYRVYRSSAEGGPWEALSAEPIPTVVFNDGAAGRGKTYWYAVTALDDAKPPKESARSTPVRVHVPGGPPAGASGGTKVR